jgi:hydrogenase maturation factor
MHNILLFITRKEEKECCLCKEAETRVFRHVIKVCRTSTTRDSSLEEIITHLLSTCPSCIPFSISTLMKSLSLMYFTFGHVSQTWKTKMYPHVTSEFSKPDIVTGSYISFKMKT